MFLPQQQLITLITFHHPQQQAGVEKAEKFAEAKYTYLYEE